MSRLTNLKIPKICFCAIFRNESKNVYRCLDAAKPIIDYVYVCDTGSDDNTIELIKKWGQENNIPTKIEIKKFKDFGYNRTYSYKQAIGFFSKADYFLLLDADMVIKISSKFNKMILTADCYYLKQDNGHIIYDNIRILKKDKRIKCVGVTHEYWDIPSDAKKVRLSKDMIYIDDCEDGGHKQNKFKRDLELLETGIYRTDGVNNQLKGRYYFYLAKTYFSLKRYDMAIQSFKERIKYPSPVEEIYYSYYQIGDCYMHSNNIEKAMFYYSKAWQYRPTRAETIYKMAHYYTFVSRDYFLAVLWAEKGLNIPIPTDVLFVEYKVYNYGFEYLLSICYYYVGQKEKGKKMSEELLKKELPDNIRTSVENNLKFYK
jgi:tetratricopeptide (TPR) repeat protein